MKFCCFQIALISLLVGSERVKSDDVVKATAILDAPFMMLKENSGELEGNDRFHGFCKDLADLIFGQLNLKYTISIQEDAKYGTIGGNSSTGWNGMIHEVLSKNADIALGAITMRADRLKAVRFSHPFMSSGLGIMMRKPSIENIDKSCSPLRPFTVSVWLSIAAVYLIFVFLAYLISKFTKLENFTLKESFGYPVKALTGQSFAQKPASFTMRIFFAIWWIFAFVMIAIYLLTFREILGQPDKTGESCTAQNGDLELRKDMTFGVMRHSSTHYFVQHSNNPKAAEIFAKLEKNLPQNYHEGFGRVLNSSNYGFLGESWMIDYYTNRAPCNTYRYDPKLNDISYGFVTAQDSALITAIDEVLVGLLYNGTVMNIKDKWWTQSECPKVTCSSIKPDSVNPLDVQNLFGVYVLFIIGLLIGFVSLAIELCFCRSGEVDRQKPIEHTQNKI